ncbi:MAG TPA: hypothetical protein VF928_03245 [Usitatibacteraceae bacterium]
MHKRRRFLAAALGSVAAAALPGCYTIHETPPGGVPAAGSRHVMLVGRIEVVPRMATGEQDIDIKNDLFNTKRYMLGRAVIQMADRPDPGSLHALSAEFLNPTLEQTFFLVLPRSERFIAKGSVTMEWRDLTPSSKAMNVESAELKFPAPLEIDIRPDDQAIYIGTVRLHRDVFHTLLKVELLDQHAAALIEFRKRFGPQAALRKALLKLPQESSRPARQTGDIPSERS